MAQEILKITTAIDKKADDRLKKSAEPNIIYGTDYLGNQTVYDKDEITNTLVKYNLTSQLDGETQTFDIDESITNNVKTFITYQGLRFELGYHYAIDYVNHTLTTLFDNAPDSDNGRMLFLYVGNDSATHAGEVNDVIVNGKSVVTSGIANINLSDYFGEQEWIDNDLELTIAAVQAQFASNSSLQFVFIPVPE